MSINANMSIVPDTSVVDSAAAPAAPAATPEGARLRRRRARCIIGMLVCVALVNGIQYGYLQRQPVVGPLVLIAGSVMLLSGIVLIALFIASCWAYARLRGYSGWIGFAGALVGLSLWLGITIYLQWPIIDALLKSQPTPDWDDHPPVALFAGLIAGGLLLKSLPARAGSEIALQQKPSDPLA